MKEIIIGQGLGPVKFGMTRDQVEALLGAPDEVEENVDIDEDLDEAAEAWHYDELEMSASFDMEDDWRLGMMAISTVHVVEALPKLQWPVGRGFALRIRLSNTRELSLP